jgi:AhpD family alkylhydroperoxidase
MHDKMYPLPTKEVSQRRRELTPEVDKAFHDFSDAAFAEGALPRKVKQLIAVAAAHTTQCPYCIRSHTQAALREGASEGEIMESIWVASEMRAGAAFAHSNIALETMADAAHR